MTNLNHKRTEKKLKTFNKCVFDWNDDSERVRQEVIRWIKEWFKHRKVKMKDMLPMVDFLNEHTRDNWKSFVFDASAYPDEDLIHELDVVEFPIRFFELKSEDLK